MADGAGRIRLRRDGQQWEFDRAINETGKVFHYQVPGRGPLPPSAKMHAMISKHLGKIAQRLERLAEAEAAARNDLTALEFYFQASGKSGQAQHTVLVNNDEKKLLHASAIRCFDQVRSRTSGRWSATSARRAA